ncbi:MAG: TetR/AcrR family transcriptional regulator [Bacteroidetes bacterium]|nr:TetR/AcrR family transcriptional regulator [Bacteroidota bacterium]
MENTSEYIIKKIAPIFNKQGFIGTSLSDLTKVTNLTKGALYCNFANKEELALKSFQLNIKKTITPLYSILRREKNSINKLLALTNYYRTYYELAKERGGCPVLNVGIDAKHNNIALYDEAKKESNKLVLGLSMIIQNGIDNKEIIKSIDAIIYAMNIYAMIEGAIFMSFMQENSDFLNNILNHIDLEIINKMKV